MAKLLTLAAVTSAVTASALSATAFKASSSPVSRVPRSTILPFHTNKEGMPLIEAEVDGVRGVLLLDTGNPYAFLINRDLVSLPDGIAEQGGHFASGQKVVLMSHPGQHSVVLAKTLRIPARGDVDGERPGRTMSTDAQQQEVGIDPRFLGWIGYGFLKDYNFEIDPSRRTIILQPIRWQRRDVSKSGLVVAFRPSSPVRPFTLRIGTYDVPAIIDTAGWDRLALASNSKWDALRDAGYVTEGPGPGCVSLHKAFYLADELGISDVEKAVRPEERATLGVRFLSKYASAWNSETGTVTLRRVGAPTATKSVSCG